MSFEERLVSSLETRSEPSSPMIEQAKARQTRIWELERELEKKKLEKLRRSKQQEQSLSPSPNELRNSNSPSPSESSSPLRNSATPEKKRNANRQASKSDDENEKEINKKGSIMDPGEKEKQKKRLSGYDDSVKESRKVRSSPQLRAFASKIDRRDLKFVRKIGEGSFGVVWEGECFQGPVAIKIPKVDMQALDDKDMEYLINEINVMVTNNHPHIITCLGACIDRENFAIVLEKLDGDLDELFYGKNSSIGKQMSLYQRMNLVKDTAIGMNWLHSVKPAIIHRDLKLENLMYKKIHTTYSVKICDFGLSVIKPEKTKLIGRGEGNTLTMAPEIMMGHEYNQSADVYSFAIILWQILTADILLPELQTFEDFEEKVAIQGERPPMPDTLPEIQELLRDCWQGEPEKRPTFKDINLRLDIILVKAAIRDSEASNFWTSSFGFKRPDHIIEWEEFIDFFCEYLGLPSPYEVKSEGEKVDKHYWSNIVCLKEVLVTKVEKKEQVQIERFGQVVNWFGPLKQAGSSRTMLDTIRHVLKQKWFHGDISGTEAVKKIAKTKPGTFLIRFSTSNMGAFTSTIQTEKGPVHARIFRDAKGEFYFSDEEEHPYPTLCDLVENHDLFIYPCEDWPYATCFPDEGSGNFIASLTGRRPKTYLKKGYIFSAGEVDTNEISKVRKKSRKKKKEEEEQERAKERELEAEKKANEEKKEEDNQEEEETQSANNNK